MVGPGNQMQTGNTHGLICPLCSACPPYPPSLQRVLHGRLTPNASCYLPLGIVGDRQGLGGQATRPVVLGGGAVQVLLGGASRQEVGVKRAAASETESGTAAIRRVAESGLTPPRPSPKPFPPNLISSAPMLGNVYPSSAADTSLPERLARVWI
ncbi:hypothetical protein SKAU_G00030770 [Synaphobranchus kaupii]|uniref:Uncharacterized protein n=1 Tax=Synaphobranchus kaupii TaxID=118154 RepID=A0A9Q1GF05_SYNKA|nr:hypothetical protein SKAU_G00030770 [Synaphobranchus kaupii]